MATNLKEYFRESIVKYLTKIKDKIYTKDEINTIINNDKFFPELGLFDKGKF